MQAVLFREVVVVDPEGPHNGKTLDIRIKEGRIETIAAANSLQLIDGETLLEKMSVSPGFVDMRCYLNDPGEEWKEDLRSLGAAGAAGGFTRLLTMPNTQPCIDNAAMVEALMARSQTLPVTLMPAGALSEGAKGKDLGEVYDMHRAGAQAFCDGEHPTDNSGLLLRGLQYLKSFDALLIDLPQDSSLDGKGGVAETPFTASLGLQGSPALAEELRISRNLRLLEYFPGRLHMGPLTGKGCLPALAEAKKGDFELSLETSAAYLLFDDESLGSFDPNYKLHPPLREASDREALLTAVAEGTIDVISSSHCPQSIDERRVEFQVAEQGAVALESCFSVAWTAFSTQNHSIESLVRAMSTNPRSILRVEAAHIAEGNQAELTFFDENQNWTPQANEFRTKGVNNPYVGMSLKGKVKGTFHKGRLNVN